MGIKIIFHSFTQYSMAIIDLYELFLTFFAFSCIFRLTYTNKEDILVSSNQGYSKTNQPKDKTMTRAIIHITAMCDDTTGEGAYRATTCFTDENNQVIDETVINKQVSNTTNHRLELTAIIEALSAIEPGVEVQVVSSNEHIINALGKKAYLDRWRKYEYRALNKKTGETITRPHKDLWETVYFLADDLGMFSADKRAKAWKHRRSADKTMYSRRVELNKYKKTQQHANSSVHQDRVRVAEGRKPLNGHPDRIEVNLPHLKPLDLKSVGLSGRTNKGRTMDEFRKEAHAIRNG